MRKKRYSNKPAMTSSCSLTLCFITVPCHPYGGIDGGKMDGFIDGKKSRYEHVDKCIK